MIADADDTIVRVGGHRNGNADKTARPQQAVSGRPSRECRNVNAVIAVGAVVGAEDRVKALRVYESLLDIGGRNGHAVARLVARAAGAAIRAQALKKRAREVDAATNGAVGFRSARGVRKESAIGDERELLPVYPDDRN